MNGQKKTKKKKRFYRFLCWCVDRCYKKVEYEGLENLPKEPCIVAGNHAQMHGPLINELYFPEDKSIWCANEVTSLKTFPAFAYKDFWPNKPKWIRWFYKGLAYVIAPLAVYIFKSADSIPVYNDMRFITTFKLTTEMLESGKKVVIFPEYYAPYNEIMSDFNARFVDVAKFYYKKTGKCLKFVPVYHAPTIKKVVIGKPIEYKGDLPIEEQRVIITEYLKEEITKLAKSLPNHIVVPHDNVSKDKFVTSLGQPIEKKKEKVTE